MSNFLRKLVFGEDETLGKITIVTPNGRMKFEADFNDCKDLPNKAKCISYS